MDFMHLKYKNTIKCIMAAAYLIFLPTACMYIQMARYLPELTHCPLEDVDGILNIEISITLLELILST